MAIKGIREGDNFLKRTVNAIGEILVLRNDYHSFMLRKSLLYARKVLFSHLTQVYAGKILV